MRDLIDGLGDRLPTMGAEKIDHNCANEGKGEWHLRKRVRKAWENGYAERLMRTIKEKEVDLSEYRNFREAYERIEEFLEEV